ncbi:hypothetical protein SVAN01_01820 [Stagonosporopsis vannaccii]|nr:hypothetical protein SVAN01_01820 [Stagonosporopsis vannaccii]
MAVDLGMADKPSRAASDHQHQASTNIAVKHQVSSYFALNSESTSLYSLHCNAQKPINPSHYPRTHLNSPPKHLITALPKPSQNGMYAAKTIDSSERRSALWRAHRRSACSGPCMSGAPDISDG